LRCVFKIRERRCWQRERWPTHVEPPSTEKLGPTRAMSVGQKKLFVRSPTCRRRVRKCRTLLRNNQRLSGGCEDVSLMLRKCAVRVARPVCDTAAFRAGDQISVTGVIPRPG
jgi:hypothetical protein